MSQFYKTCVVLVVIHKIGKNKLPSEMHRHAHNHTFSRSKSTTTKKFSKGVSVYKPRIVFVVIHEI